MSPPYELVVFTYGDPEAAESAECLSSLVLPNATATDCPSGLWLRLSLLLASLILPQRRFHVHFSEFFSPREGRGWVDEESVLGRIATKTSQLSSPDAFLTQERLDEVGYALEPWRTTQLTIVYNERLTAPVLNMNFSHVFPPAIVAMLAAVWIGRHALLLGQHVFGRQDAPQAGMRFVLFALGLTVQVFQQLQEANVVRFYNRPVQSNEGIRDLKHLMSLSAKLGLRVMYDSAVFMSIARETSEAVGAFARDYFWQVSESKHLEMLRGQSPVVSLTFEYAAQNWQFQEPSLRITSMPEFGTQFLTAYTNVPPLSRRRLGVPEKAILQDTYLRLLKEEIGAHVGVPESCSAGRLRPLSVPRMRVVWISFAASSLFASLLALAERIGFLLTLRII